MSPCPRRFAGVLATLVLSSSSSIALAQWRCGGEQKLTPPDHFVNDIYGAAVSVDDDAAVAVIANEWDDDQGVDSGSVFVYRHNGQRWVQEQKVLPSDGQAGDNFGRSVSIQGDWLAVGAHWDDDNGSRSGSAYLFHFDGEAWVQRQKLRAFDGQTGDRFGNTIALDLPVVAVGAWLDDNAAGTNAGASYVFRFNGMEWALEQKLTASDGEGGDTFGRYVSVSGDAVVVGAHLEDSSGTSSGCAYAFRWNGATWQEEQKLVPSDGAAGDQNGWATFVQGNVAVVGSHLDDDNGTDSGSAYVYRYDGSAWNEEQKLLASDGKAGDWFGYSLAIDDGLLLSAAPVDLEISTTPGAAYLYRDTGSGWVEEEKLAPSDGAPQDEFGFHASFHGKVALVGAWRDDEAGPDSGSAYFYRCLRRWTQVAVPPLEASGGVRTEPGFGELRSLGAPASGEPWSLELARDPRARVGLVVVGPAVSGVDGVRWIGARRWLAPTGADDRAFRFRLRLPDESAVLGAPLLVRGVSLGGDGPALTNGILIAPGS